VGGIHNGVLDGGIACATAERIFQCVTQLIRSWIGVALEKRVGGHDLARDAESTLHRTMLNEGFLQGMQDQLAVLCISQAFDGQDVLAIRTTSRINARKRRFAIHENGADAAFSLFAADLSTGQFQALAQGIG